MSSFREYFRSRSRDSRNELKSPASADDAKSQLSVSTQQSAEEKKKQDLAKAHEERTRVEEEKQNAKCISDVRRTIALMYLAGFGQAKVRKYLHGMPQYSVVARIRPSLVKWTDVTYRGMQQHHGERSEDYVAIAQLGPKEVRRRAKELYRDVDPTYKETEEVTMEEIENWRCNWTDEVEILKQRQQLEAAEKLEEELKNISKRELIFSFAKNLETFNKGEPERLEDLNRSPYRTRPFKFPESQPFSS